MSIVSLPLPPDTEARALLQQVLEHGDVVGRDRAGRRILQLAVESWVLDKLMGFDADTVEHEDGGDAEPDADERVQGPPLMLSDVVLPRVIKRRRHLALVPGPAD